MVAALIVNFAILFTIPAILRIRAERFLKSPHVDRWADRFGVALTLDNTPYIREHLATGMKWRHRGGFIGMLIANTPGLISAITQKSSGVPSVAGPPFTGYLVGTALAEGIRWRQGLVGTTRASLARRTPADYVARWGRGLLVGLVVASAAIAPATYRQATSGGYRLGIATSGLPTAGDLIVDGRGLTKTILNWLIFLAPTTLIGVGYHVAMTNPWRHSTSVVTG